VEPKDFFSIFFLTYVIMSGIFDTIGNGVKDVFNSNCWRWSDEKQQNINTCIISGDAVLASVGLYGFGGAAGGPSKTKSDHLDFSGCNRATQGQPLYGIQTKIQQPSSMASNINIR